MPCQGRTNGTKMVPYSDYLSLLQSGLRNSSSNIRVMKNCNPYGRNGLGMSWTFGSTQPEMGFCCINKKLSSSIPLKSRLKCSNLCIVILWQDTRGMTKLYKGLSGIFNGKACGRKSRGSLENMMFANKTSMRILGQQGFSSLSPSQPEFGLNGLHRRVAPLTRALSGSGRSG
jgi:hypothetical protein